MQRLMPVLFLIVMGACSTPFVAGAERSPGAAGVPAELNVFAAASLTDAFKEIGRSFEAAQPGTTVVFNFAGSQQLAQQIGQGAAVDVFASANLAQMTAVIEEGRVVSGAERIFAHNRLLVAYPAENPAGLASLHDLAAPGVKLVLAAKEVPVGRYSLEFLDKASQDPAFGPAYRQAVMENIVSYEQNVRAVLSKVVLAEADAGIVYGSDVASVATDEVGTIDIPDELNVIASYPMAVISDARQPELARQFVDYVLSSEGQAILERYGITPATVTAR